MRSRLVRLWKDQSGQDLVEYVLLLLLIALMLIASTRSLSQAIGNAFETITNSVSAATTSSSGGNGNGTGGGGAP
jgi:Flp pilus assembly pilin Flp